jgi:hypothetical protein
MLETAWGVRFNHNSSYERLQKGQKPQGCPDWLTQDQVSDWQKEGLIIWNNDEKRIAHLRGAEALRLLNELTTNDSWKTEGISVKRRVIRIEFEIPHRGRRKKTTQEPPPESSKTEDTFDEIVHLPSEAGPGLIELIELNRPHVDEMAQQESTQFYQAIKMIFELSRRHELNEFDFSARSFTWERGDKNRCSCEYQETKGRICLDASLLFWHACVQRCGFVGGSEQFAEFREAVDWVERSLADLANQPPQPESHSHMHPLEQIKADHIRLKQKYLDGPFWIRSTALEPERITYHIFVELEAEPSSFKTRESMCGDTYRVDERYLTPSKQAAAIGLDFDQFSIYQPLGDNSEWYQFASLTGYYQQASAAEQAQNIWNQSHILQQFKAGKIIRGRYGYKEGETGFLEFLGACEHTEKPWARAESRDEFMELRSLRETLCFALDVNDFRDYLGLTSEAVSDEELLVTIHEDRAKSKCMPAEIKLESKLWLARQETVG